MKILLACLALITINLTSCQMMARLGSAGAGAATGAVVAGPPGAAVGAVVGLAATEVAQSEGEVEEVQEQLDEANDIIVALSEGDVTKMIGDNERGIFATVWGWLQALFTIAIILFVINVIYTIKRKKYAGEYYKKIDTMWDKLTDE